MNDIMKFDNELSIEKSRPGKRGLNFNCPSCQTNIPTTDLRKDDPKLPQLSEFDVIRHFTRLSKYNFSVDTHFYPLGSCTMKYNPRINEEVSCLEGFTCLHPLAMDENAQGTLEIIYDAQKRLCELCGMDDATLWPVAGAHGEYTGILIAKKYFSVKAQQRDEIIVPDSAHGTNPATAAMAGFKIINLKSNSQGLVDLENLKKALNPKTAVIMMTVPNTLGIFEKNIKNICDIAHENGTLVYMDGANLNALIGIVKPGDFGIDMMHLNLHKTFSTPHGGGGPGAGGILVKKILSQYLPKPKVEKKDGKYFLSDDIAHSIGTIKAHLGNTQVLLKAYAYLLKHGPKEFAQIAENAILNANYIKASLEDIFPSYSSQYCMHECVLMPSQQLMKKGIKTLDIAKRLLDYGFHAPTIYFPLIVHEAIMIEPTETESKETLDAFIAAMKKIKEEADRDPNILKNAPYTMPVKRLDEVLAARQPNVKW